MIAADPGCINIPLKVCSFIIGKGEPLSIQFCFIERQRCSLNLLLGSHIYLCDFSLGKLILKEIFLHLLCILQYQAQILSLYVTLVIRNRFFLKDIGPNRKPCDGVDASRGFRFPIGIRTAVCNPGFLFCDHISSSIVNWQAVFIVNGCFVLVDGSCRPILQHLDRARQLLLPCLIHRIGQHTLVIVIHVSHAGFRIRIAKLVSTPVQHKQFAGVWIFLGVHRLQIIEEQVYRGIVCLLDIPYIQPAWSRILASLYDFLVGSCMSVSDACYLSILPIGRHPFVLVLPCLFKLNGFIQRQPGIGH